LHDLGWLPLHLHLLQQPSLALPTVDTMAPGGLSPGRQDILNV
jgi:hypothetical protein